MQERGARCVGHRQASDSGASGQGNFLPVLRFPYRQWGAIVIQRNVVGSAFRPEGFRFLGTQALTPLMAMRTSVIVCCQRGYYVMSIVRCVLRLGACVSSFGAGQRRRPGRFW
jgi:hypothetical protein